MSAKTLGWSDIRNIGKQDKAGRWYPNDEVKEYFGAYRTPSRAWPNSYAKAAQTQKFAKWLAEHKQDIAKKLGLI